MSKGIVAAITMSAISLVLSFVTIISLNNAKPQVVPQNTQFNAEALLEDNQEAIESAFAELEESNNIILEQLEEIHNRFDRFEEHIEEMAAEEEAEEDAEIEAKAAKAKKKKNKKKSLNLDALPEEVADVIKNELKDAKLGRIRELKRNDLEYYDIEAKTKDGRKMNICITKDGTMFGKSIEIKYQMLPEDIKAAISKSAPKFKSKKAGHITLKGDTYFEVSGSVGKEKHVFIFNDQNALVKHIIDGELQAKTDIDTPKKEGKDVF